MSDEEKRCRYSDLQWDDDPPVNADQNTLKQLGEALQKKQEVNYKQISDDFLQFMNQEPTLSRCNTKQQNEQIKLSKNSIGPNKKNKQIESSMSKFIDNNIIATPNQRLFKLQILKKDNSNDNYYRDQYTDRAQDYSERRTHETNSSRYSLANGKNYLLDKLKQLNSTGNQNKEQDIQSMIEEEKQYDQLKERQSQNTNISQTEYMISSRERSHNHLQNLQKQKQEDQSIIAEKQAMQAEATSEFKRKVNQVLNQKNKEFIKQFTRMKSESKLKQSEIYSKILDFYQQKNKIDPNEIKLYQDIYTNHQKVGREMLQQLRSNQSKQDQDCSKYQVLNNTLQSKPIRVSVSAQSQRMKPTDSQQLSKQSTNESRRRFNTQVSPFDIKDVNNSQQEIESQQQQQQPQKLQQINLQKGHSYSVNHIKLVSTNKDQNNIKINHNPFDQVFNDQELLLKQNSNHHDHLLNLRLNRRILSTLRMQKDQSYNQSYKNSTANSSYAQAFHPQISNQNKIVQQDSQTQTLFTNKIRSKTRSPIKINRTSVVDQYQVVSKPLIIPNRSSSNSPIEIRNKIIQQEVSVNAEQESPRNPQLDMIQKLQIRQHKKRGLNRNINNSQSFLANMFQNQQKRAEFQNQIPQNNQQQYFTQISKRNKKQSLIINKEQCENENELQIKSTPTSVKNNQFQADILSFNLVKQIQQNTHIQKQKQQNLIDLQGYEQIGVNSNLIKQSYSLASNKTSLKNKIQSKETNVSTLSSKLFTKIKERIFMN